MVILGKSTDKGCKFNSYVIVNNPAIATHIKVKGENKYIPIASIEEVTAISNRELVPTRRMSPTERYTCTIKDEKSGENKAVEIENVLYSQVTFMTQAEEGKGEFYRTIDGRYVKKDEIQPPAYKTRALGKSGLSTIIKNNKHYIPSEDGGDDTPVDKAFVSQVKSEYVTLPTGAEALLHNGSVVEVEGDRITLPNDKVEKRGDKYYYKTDTEEIEVKYHQELVERLIELNDINLNGSKANNVVGTYSTTIDGEYVELATTTLEVEKPIFVGGLLVESQKTIFDEIYLDKEGNRRNEIQMTSEMLNSRYPRNIYRKDEVNSDGVVEVEDAYTKGWVKFTYNDGRIVVYYTDKKPSISNAEFIKVDEYNLEAAKTGQLVFSSKGQENAIANHIKLEDGKISSCNMNGESITGIKWNESGKISEYKINGTLVKDIEWKSVAGVLHITKCVLVIDDKEIKVNNLEKSKYSKYAISYQLTTEIKDIKLNQNVIESFTIAGYKFTDIKWNNNFEIESCRIDGKEIKDFAKDVRFKELRFTLQNQLKVQDLKFAVNAPMFTRENGEYKLNADLVQTEPGRTAPVRRLTSFGEGLQEIKDFKRAPYATHYIDDQGNTFKIEDFNTTYNENGEFEYNIQDNPTINRILGKNEIKFVKKGDDYDIEISPSKAEDNWSWGLVEAGVIACNTVIGLPIGVLLLSAAAITKAVCVSSRAVKKQQIKHESLEKVTSRMQKDVQKQCQKEINNLVKEYQDKVRRARKVYSPADLDKRLEGMKESFGAKYMRIASKLQLLGDGQIQSAFTWGKKGKITKDNYLGYLACVENRDVLTRGAHDHPDLATRLEEIRAKYKGLNKTGDPQFKEERKKDELREIVAVMQQLGGKASQEKAYRLKIANWELFVNEVLDGKSEQYKKLVKKSFIKELTEERVRERNSWGSINDRIAFLKTTLPYRSASREEQKAQIKACKEAYKKAHKGVSVEGARLEARLDSRGRELADELGRDAVSYMYQAMRMFTSPNESVPKFEYGCRSKYTEDDRIAYHADRPFADSMAAMASHTCDNSVSRQLATDYARAEQIVGNVESRVQGSQIYAAAEQIKNAPAHVANKGYMYGVECLAHMHTGRVVAAQAEADKMLEQIDEVKATSEGALQADRLQTLTEQLQEVKEEVSEIVEQTEQTTYALKADYDLQVEQASITQFVEEHKEDYDKFVDSRRKLLAGVGGSSADLMLTSSATLEGFIDTCMKSPKYRAELEWIRVQNDENAQIEAAAIVEMEPDKFETFANNHPEVDTEELKLRFYTSYRMKNPAALEELKKREEFKQHFFSQALKHFKTKKLERTKTGERPQISSENVIRNEALIDEQEADEYNMGDELSA